jgi:hypothetical protein
MAMEIDAARSVVARRVARRNGGSAAAKARCRSSRPAKSREGDGGCDPDPRRLRLHA